MIMKKIFISAAALILFSTAGFSQIKVTGFGGQGNPTLYFKGVSGDVELSTKVASDLKNCGWFDMAATPSANYTAEGTVSGGTATITVKDSTGATKVTFNMPVPQGKTALAADNAVDYILKKFFEVQICSSKIAFSGQTSAGVKEIYYCDFDGSNIVKATSNNTLSVEPDWMPGRSIVYTMYGKMHTDIVEYQVSSKRSRSLCQFPGLNSCASVSPDGRLMALILSKDRQVELYLKEINSKALRRMTTGKNVEASPCWSPDGGRLCYVSDTGGRPNLYVISSGGGTPVKLQTLGGESVTPSWSGDNKIAYSAKMGRNYTIAVLDLKGKDPQRIIIQAAGDWENPSWAPDNRHIVCSKTLNGKSTLYVVDTFSGKMRQLFSSGMNLSFPAWSGLAK